MLTTLPEAEAALFGDEEKLFEFRGKTDLEYQTLAARFSFVGGPLEEYILYYSREDVQKFWDFVPGEPHLVKSVVGFTAAKRCANRQT